MSMPVCGTFNAWLVVGSINKGSFPAKITKRNPESNESSGLTAFKEDFKINTLLTRGDIRLHALAKCVEEEAGS